MIIKINNQLKYIMSIKRLHGQKALEKRVISLQREGWHIPNIASLVHERPDVVREILQRQNVIIDELIK